jgi:streptomycin 6-kinase
MVIVAIDTTPDCQRRISSWPSRGEREVNGGRFLGSAGGRREDAPVLEVPEVVRNKARAVGADRWLAEVPALVEALIGEWALVPGRVFDDATEALVVEVMQADRAPAVLKLALPLGDAVRHEITTLRLAGGEGCAALLRADEERGALLLERLGRSLHELGLPIGRRQEILYQVVRRVWQPAAGCGLPTGAEKAVWHQTFITATWEELDRPCSERAVEHAIRCAERRRRAHEDERSVLVHGDVHEWNALESAAGGGFKLVDPDGLLAEAEYDLGVMMREDPVELIAGGDPRARARRLAAMSGFGAEAIWEWGVVERLSSGLLLSRLGLQPVGREMLHSADVIARDAGDEVSRDRHRRGRAS